MYGILQHSADGLPTPLHLRRGWRGTERTVPVLLRVRQRLQPSARETCVRLRVRQPLPGGLHSRLRTPRPCASLYELAPAHAQVALWMESRQRVQRRQRRPCTRRGPTFQLGLQQHARVLRESMREHDLFRERGGQAVYVGWCGEWEGVPLREGLEGRI
jgi:hypothetical protein